MNMVVSMLIWRSFSEIRDNEFDGLFRFLILIDVNFFVELEEGLFAHTTNINDLLKSLDSVLEDWFDRLHNTESSLHIVDLWLHTLNGFHFSSNFNKGLTIVKSFKDSSGKSFLDVLDRSCLGNSGVSITLNLGLSVELSGADTRQK